jgi:hypothetical protein
MASPKIRSPRHQNGSGKRDSRNNKVKSSKTESNIPEPVAESYVERINYWTKPKNNNLQPEGVPLDVDNLQVFDHTREDVADDIDDSVRSTDIKGENLKEQAGIVYQTSPVDEVIKVNLAEDSEKSGDQETTTTESIEPVEQKKELETSNTSDKDTSDLVDESISGKPKATIFSPKPFKLPSFLSNINLEYKSKNKENSNQDFYLQNLTISNPKEKVQSEEKLKQDLIEKQNSFASIFNKDQDQISSIKRVFRKSILFMLLGLFSFGLTSLFSNAFLWNNWALVLCTAFVYVSLTNIFFIIVAHRTYIWLFLFGTLIITLITQGFQNHTLVIALAITLLTYLAYLDLEKIQLGSRIFSVPYIVGESTKLLSTIVVIIISLSVANQVLLKGLDNFVSDNFLANTRIMDNLVRPITFNFVLSGPLKEQQRNQQFQTIKAIVCSEQSLICTGADFNKRTVLTADKYRELELGCVQKNTPVEQCNAQKEIAENEVLDKFKIEIFPNANVNLNTRVTDDNYRTIFRSYYQAKIKSLSNPENLKFLPESINRQTVYPTVLGVVLFLLLSILKFAFVWLSHIVTWVFWKVLLVFGFARIDVEMVEAEIVGI